MDGQCSLLPSGHCPAEAKGPVLEIRAEGCHFRCHGHVIHDLVRRKPGHLSAHESRSHSVGVSHLSLSALSLKHLCGYRHDCEPRGRLAICGHGALFWCLSLMVITSTPSQPPVTPVPHAADACLGIQDTSSGETPCELPNHRHTPTGWTGGSPRETVKSSAVLTARELCLRSFASFQ